MNNEKKAPVRQLKYRAYCLVEEKIFPVTQIDWKNELITVNEGDNTITDTFDMFILMQFTGLIDKNGKEVYEGDMVLGSMKYKGVTLMPFRAFVFYNEKVACWQIKYETTTNNFATDFIYSYEIEIVGHIHEGKETKGNG